MERPRPRGHERSAGLCFQRFQISPGPFLIEVSPQGGVIAQQSDHAAGGKVELPGRFADLVVTGFDLIENPGQPQGIIGVARAGAGFDFRR